MKLVKLHSRTMRVQAARVEIQRQLIELQQEHDLTDIEMLQILGDGQAQILKYMLRAERHPDNPETKADEAGDD